MKPRFPDPLPEGCTEKRPSDLPPGLPAEWDTAYFLHDIKISGAFPQHGSKKCVKPVQTAQGTDGLYQSLTQLFPRNGVGICLFFLY